MGEAPSLRKTKVANSENGQSFWPLPFVTLAVMLSPLTLFSSNTIEWLLVIFIGLLGLRELLKIDSLPVHLAFIFPFLEISTSLADAELNGADVNTYFYGHGSEVVVFSLFALTSCYIGWKLSSSSVWIGQTKEALEATARLSLQKLILLYFASELIVLAVDAVIPYGSSLAQLEKHVGVFRLVFLALTILSFRASPRQYLLFWGFMIYVVVTSLFSFFSAWKGVFILATFVLLIQEQVPSLRVVRNLGIVLGIGVLFVLTWQGIKSEYRNFLNQGSRIQRVEVNQSEALTKLKDLVYRFWFEDPEELGTEWYAVVSHDEAFQSTLERIGYVDLFSRMRQYVPEELPHEKGRLLKGNLVFALVPRILNPNKGVKNDQLKVEKYAKRRIADNASFSLGHYAEHYIDFGMWGMIFSLFIFGVIGGYLTKWSIMDGGIMRPVDAVFCFYWMQFFVSYQFDAIKIYGLVFWALLTYKFLFRRQIEKMIEWAGS